MLKAFIKYVVICAMLIPGATVSVRAQDPVFSQFYASPLSVNPALAGNGDADWRLVGISRNQWIASGVDPLNTTSLSFDGKLFKQKSNEKNYIGGGLLFLLDKGLGGAYKSNSLNLIVSSHVSLDQDDANGLSVGLGGTYSNTTIDFSQLTFGSQLSSAGFNRTLPTSEPYLTGIKPYYSLFAGITYTFTGQSSNFDIGVSGYRFMKTNRSALNDPNQFDPPRYNFHADYQAYINETEVFNANALYVIESTVHSFTVGINIGSIIVPSEESPTVLNTGLWYRSNEAIIPYLGLAFGNIQAGLSYDINTSPSGSSLGTLKTFELSLTFQSPQKRPNPLPCPWK